MCEYVLMLECIALLLLLILILLFLHFLFIYPPNSLCLVTSCAFSLFFLMWVLGNYLNIYD